MYIIVQLFILLFSLLYLQLFLLLFMHIVSSARAVSPLHTHSLWSRSDDPGFARPDIGRLFLMCRYSMRRYALRIAGASSYSTLVLLHSCSCYIPWFLYVAFSLSLYSCYFMTLSFIAFNCLILVIIHMLPCVVLYVSLQWSGLDYNLFRLT